MHENKVYLVYNRVNNFISFIYFKNVEFFIETGCKWKLDFYINEDMKLYNLILL